MSISDPGRAKRHSQINLLVLYTVGIRMDSMIRVRMSAQRLSKPIELSKSCWPWHSGCHTAQILVSLPYKAKRVCNLLFKVFPLSTLDNRNFRRSIRLFSICVVSCSQLSLPVQNRLTFLFVLPSLVQNSRPHPYSTSLSNFESAGMRLCVTHLRQLHGSG